MRELRSCAFAPNHNRRSWIEAHDVPLHLVHPLRVESLREAVDHDHELPNRRVRPQSTEALVRRFVGQVRRLYLATVAERRSFLVSAGKKSPFVENPPLTFCSSNAHELT